MSRQNCRRDRAHSPAQAECAARGIARLSFALEEELPMHRYTYPIPLPGTAPACPALCGEGCAPLERILEVLAGQTQLLVDLLGAVNALTAATLAAQCRR